jgi:hypothetical protein
VDFVNYSLFNTKSQVISIIIDKKKQTNDQGGRSMNTPMSEAYGK